MTYRDDLEAAQARADALEREAAELREKNAALENKLAARARPSPPEMGVPTLPPTIQLAPALRRRISAVGLVLLVVGFGVCVGGIIADSTSFVIPGLLVGIVGVIMLSLVNPGSGD